MHAETITLNIRSFRGFLKKPQKLIHAKWKSRQTNDSIQISIKIKFSAYLFYAMLFEFHVRVYYLAPKESYINVKNNKTCHEKLIFSVNFPLMIIFCTLSKNWKQLLKRGPEN